MSEKTYKVYFMEQKKMYELLKSGTIQATFNGTGKPTGQIGALTVKNTTTSPQTFTVPRGMVIRPASADTQTMLNGTPIPVRLGPKEERVVPIDDGYCNDDYTKPPPSGALAGSTIGFTDESDPEQGIISTVERNIQKGAYNAKRLMKEDKARQTLIQWTLWRRANPETFNKEQAKKIIFTQLSGRKRAPPAEEVERGVALLFDDIDLTVKETPGAGAPPVAGAKDRPCACRGTVTPDAEQSEPDVKISEHYRSEDDRARIRADIVEGLSEGGTQVTPSTVCAFSQSGAAVGAYGDARAAYLFIERPGSFYGAHYLNRTERLRASARGSNTIDITVTHEDHEGCRYETIVGAAAVGIVGAAAMAYDPLEGTEGGFRFFEGLYEQSKEAIKQEWITSILDSIKDATTKYEIEVGSQASIRVEVGSSSNRANNTVSARMRRDGSELLTPREDLVSIQDAYATASECTLGDHLTIRFDGETVADIYADDGGKGIVGQESMIGYVWYWACKTIKDGEETVEAKWGHDWAFATVDEGHVEATIELREYNTQQRMQAILDATVGNAAHTDPFDCSAIRPALESSLRQWVEMLARDLGAYASVVEDMRPHGGEE